MPYTIPIFILLHLPLMVKSNSIYFVSRIIKLYVKTSRIISRKNFIKNGSIVMLPLGKIEYNYTYSFQGGRMD